MLGPPGGAVPARAALRRRSVVRPEVGGGRGGGGAAMKRDVRILRLGEGEGNGGRGTGTGSSAREWERGAREGFSCKGGARGQLLPPLLAGPGARAGPPVAPGPWVSLSCRCHQPRLRSWLAAAAVPLKLCRAGASVNVLPLFPSPGGEDVSDHGSGGRGVS